jgi:hypothetical protein
VMDLGTVRVFGYASLMRRGQVKSVRVFHLFQTKKKSVRVCGFCLDVGCEMWIMAESG